MTSSSPRKDRRSFLTQVTSLSALAMFSPASLAESEESFGTSPWDLSWIGAFKGKHKQVFDFGSINWDNRDIPAGDTPLRVPRNYLNAHKEVFNLEPPQVNAIVGITSHAFPINASDRIWKKYSLGELWHIKDGRTKDWATRNVFSDPAPEYSEQLTTIEALTKRGVVFWQCNNALRAVTATIASAMKLKPEDVQADLLNGFMPGVKLVPAHTMALGLAQENGFTYEKI